MYGNLQFPKDWEESFINIDPETELVDKAEPLHGRAPITRVSTKLENEKLLYIPEYLTGPWSSFINEDGETYTFLNAQEADFFLQVYHTWYAENGQY